jgi:MbtH protein
MTNPFEDDSTEYLVVVNAEDQHSLWPAFIDVPGGWRAAYGPESRLSCLDYVSRNWVDMRPKSLILETQEARSQSEAKMPLND